MRSYYRSGASSESVRRLDRIIFLLFTFCYLFFFQTDLERHVHIIITNNIIAFHPLWIALLFTAIDVFIAIPVSALLKFKGAWEPCNYLPSILLLCAATSYNDEYFVGHSLLFWIVIIIVSALFLLFCGFVSNLRCINDINDRNHVLSINLFLVMLLMMLPPLIGNTDRISHYEMRMERMFADGKYDDLLRVGHSDKITTASMEEYRALSLAYLKDKSTKVDGDNLGRYLFEYPQKYANRTARILEADTTYGAVHENMELAAMLLRKRVSDFAGRMYYAPDTVDVTYSKWQLDMPQYYMQALLLNDILSYDSTQFLYDRYPRQAAAQRAVLDDYLRRKEMLSAYSVSIQSDSLYGDFHRTYFWYYDFSR